MTPISPYRNDFYIATAIQSNESSALPSPSGIQKNQEPLTEPNASFAPAQFANWLNLEADENAEPTLPTLQDWISHMIRAVERLEVRPNDLEVNDHASRVLFGESEPNSPVNVERNLFGDSEQNSPVNVARKLFAEDSDSDIDSAPAVSRNLFG